jgi:hypothetical protein
VTILYLDTSALVKHYITEPGSDWIGKLVEDQGHAVFTSRLTIIESACTFARRQREGMLSLDDLHRLLAIFDYDFSYRYHVLDVEPVVIDTARQLASRHPLRAYDAVQLASGWLLNQELLRNDKPSLTFIAADERLIGIAQTESLLTDNPQHHP